MKIILTGDKIPKEILVDDDVYEWASKFTWRTDYTKCPVRSGMTKYKKKTNHKLHRVIMNCPIGMVVDHINHNTLDNRRVNLRVCTNAQNMMNRSKKTIGSSKYKGVSWNKKDRKWKVSIQVNRKPYHIGEFTSEIDAAQAYNQAALIHHGTFAYLNQL